MTSVKVEPMAFVDTEFKGNEKDIEKLIDKNASATKGWIEAIRSNDLTKAKEILNKSKQRNDFINGDFALISHFGLDDRKNECINKGQTGPWSCHPRL